METSSFNRLCSFVEKCDQTNLDGLEILRNALTCVKLFYFEGDATEFLPKKIEQEQFDEFKLPFPCVAVEDAISVVVISEEKNNSNEGVKRHFWVFWHIPKNGLLSLMLTTMICPFQLQ